MQPLWNAAQQIPLWDAKQQAQLQLKPVTDAADLFQRLSFVCRCAGSKFAEGSVCVLQPWLSLPVCNGAAGCSQQQEGLLFPSPMLGIDSGNGFLQFRRSCCMSPLSHRNSIPGRVWRTGALQIVQSLQIIPHGVHPRSSLSDEDLDKVAEALYIPVYDSLRPDKGTVSVLEVFLSSKADSVSAADFISFVSSCLVAVCLSLSNPQPQPIHPSPLCGRRARAPDDSAEDLQAAEGAAEEKVQVHVSARTPGKSCAQQVQRHEGDAGAPTSPARVSETHHSLRHAHGAAANEAPGTSTQPRAQYVKRGSAACASSAGSCFEPGPCQPRLPSQEEASPDFWDGGPDFEDSVAPRQKIRRLSMMRTKSMHSVISADTEQSGSTAHMQCRHRCREAHLLNEGLDFTRLD